MSKTSDEPDDEPVAGASIRVVSNRTGIPPDTLRMWERRYGFPRPSRRPGGSRVYSEADVARLHLVSRALRAGFRPSEVLALPFADLSALVEASVAETPARRAGRTSPAGDGERGGRFRGPVVGTPGIAAIIEALRADDVVLLRGLLRAAAVSLGPRGFVTELAHPLLVRVGDLWADGTIEVRHEHVVSACITAQLHLLLGALEDGDRSPVVLLATLPSEPHLLGIEMVAVYLAASLAAPRVLGADSPPAQIVEAARAFHADAVGLSISPAAEGRAAARAVSTVAAALPSGVELWLGGAGARAIAGAATQARIIATWPELDAALSSLQVGLRPSLREPPPGATGPA